MGHLQKHSEPSSLLLTFLCDFIIIADSKIIHAEEDLFSPLQAHDQQAAPGHHHFNGARHSGRRDLPEVLPEVRARLRRGGAGALPPFLPWSNNSVGVSERSETRLFLRTFDHRGHASFDHGRSSEGRSLTDLQDEDLLKVTGLRTLRSRNQNAPKYFSKCS